MTKRMYTSSNICKAIIGRVRGASPYWIFSDTPSGKCWHWTEPGAGLMFAIFAQAVKDAILDNSGATDDEKRQAAHYLRDPYHLMYVGIDKTWAREQIDRVLDYALDRSEAG